MTNKNVCGHCSISEYVSLLSKNMSLATCHLFVFDGKPLTKLVFVSLMRMYLTLIDLDPSEYSGHSFRSGCATSAAMAGLSDWEIKLLGHWTSDAYQRYIRAPQIMLASFSARISQNQPTNNSVFTLRNSYIKNVI